MQIIRASSMYHASKKFSTSKGANQAHSDSDFFCSDLTRNEVNEQVTDVGKFYMIHLFRMT